MALPKNLQLKNVQAELCRRNLSTYIKDAWPVVEPGDYLHNWHIDAISDHLMAVTRGEIRRLIINIPPRMMKSTAVAVMWPTWSWIDRPNLRWLYSSYALSLSIRDAQRSRRILESSWYQERWGSIVHLREDQNAKSYYENTLGGARLSISVGSSATGHGGDIIVCDDPHNAQEADSAVVREATLNWWAETMTSRLNNPKTGAFVIVMQRLHERDLTGYLLAQGGYEHLCLPLEYEDRKLFTNLKWTDSNDILHEKWCDPRGQRGELLWPDRINEKTTQELKRALGSYGYAAQYQQTPSPTGGGIFKKEWFRYFYVTQSENGPEYELITPKDTIRYAMKDCRHFITVDLAASLREMADFTVVAVWAWTKNNDLLLVDVTRDRYDAHDQQNAIILKHKQYGCEFIDVEASGYQLTMVQQLIRKGLPVREYKPVRDKVSRARTASIRYQAGTIYHLRHAPWLVEYEMEMLGFPTSDHDDQVDVTSRAAEIVVGDVQPNIRSLEPDEEDIKDVQEFEKRQAFKEFRKEIMRKNAESTMKEIFPEEDWDEEQGQEEEFDVFI